jgi:hypothetical protein
MQLVITHKVMVEMQNQFVGKGISIEHGERNKNILQAHQKTSKTIC